MDAADRLAHLERYLDESRRFFETQPVRARPGTHAYTRLLAGYYRHMIPADASVLEIGCGSGGLLAALPNRSVTGIDISGPRIEAARRNVPHGRFFTAAGEHFMPDETFDVIIISDTLNLAADVQTMLMRARRMAHADTRLIVNFHNAMWRPVRWLAERAGLVRANPSSSWLTVGDVRNLSQLAGWDVVSNNARILMPFQVPGVTSLFNRWIARVIPWFCLTMFQVSRPATREAGRSPSVSVLVPARNEAGNIPSVLARTPRMGAWMEFIFVEGGSTDDTWAEIERLRARHPALRIKALRQTGRGKGNAVREGFAIAEGDVLMILDADLTMPPEELPKYLDAVASGMADVANGVRLVYPMEGRAMQFWNLCANKAFALGFSWVLSQPVKDTLCGTKVLRRTDYLKIAANRARFGDFDPFGDFDLLFGAGGLHLKIVDIPVRYRDRVYGETNISRWRHGVLLLRMFWFGARKLKCL